MADYIAKKNYLEESKRLFRAKQGFWLTLHECDRFVREWNDITERLRKHYGWSSKVQK